MILALRFPMPLGIALGSALVFLFFQCSKMACAAERAAGTPASVSAIQQPADYGGYTKMGEVLSRISSRVSNIVPLGGRVLGEMPRGVDLGAPADHKGASTVQVEFVYKNGYLADFTCQNQDGRGIHVTFYSDGHVASYWELDKGRPDGVWLDVAPNGNPTSLIELRDGKIQGHMLSWTADGKLTHSEIVTEPRPVILDGPPKK